MQRKNVFDRPSTFLSIIIAFSLVLASCSIDQKSTLYDLTCDDYTNPIHIDDPNPGFSWKIDCKKHHFEQSAYQILVASSLDLLNKDVGNLWDSKKVLSDQSAFVEYDGDPLKSNQRYFWKVRIWDKNDRVIGYSEPAWFETAFLPGDAWEANWIGSSNTLSGIDRWQWNSWIWYPHQNTGEKPVYFRKQFTLLEGKQVQSAFLRAVGDEYFEFWFNGKHLLEGDIWVRTSERELKPDLVEGVNTIAVRGKNNNRNTPYGGINFSLRIRYEDGSEEYIFSDSTWKTTLNSSEHWVEKKYDDANWDFAKEYGKLDDKFWKRVDDHLIPPRSLLIRNEFNLKKPVAKAKVYATGLGIYNLHLNGGKVGKDYLTPEWTDYHHRIQYQTYDVTDQLSQGVNTMGAILGNGWWSSDLGWPDPNKGLEWYNKDTLCFAAELHVTYKDGSKEKIFTDSGWKYDYSPITENTILHGERYDARLEQEGWDTVGFNDEDWQPCEKFDMQFDHVVSQQQPPIRVVEELSPEKELKLDDGAIIYDFGKQITGFAKIKTQGEPGTQITIRFVEKLKDSVIYNENLRTARQTDAYILKGGETEVWQPRFTYHGFRYAEVRFDPAPPDSFQITGVALRSSFDRTGTFECSNQLINQIHQNAVNTMNCVNLGYPSDNNSRDERLGWTYDAQITTPALNYNFNALNFMQKYLNDMKDGRHEEGYVVPVAPRIIHHEREFPGWSDAIIIIPYHLYSMYGDKKIITENYDAMKKWLDITIKTQHVDDRRSSDHNPLSQKYSKFGTAIFINCLNYFVELAQVIDKKEDAEFYHNKAEELKQQFNRRYFNQDENTYNPDIQFSYATALAWDVYPEGHREQVAESLADRVQLADWHVTTGFLGTRFLFQALSENRYHEDAYRIVTQTSYPSYGYMVEKGATSMWERWNSDTAKPGMNTMAHVGFVSIDQWFYAYLAGIRPKIENPGFKHFIIDPKPADGLDYVNASLETAYGTIKSSWNTSDSAFQLKASVPPNTKADVTIPSRKGKQIQINGKSLFDGEKLTANDLGISLIRNGDHETLFRVGSGEFIFDSEWE